MRQIIQVTLWLGIFCVLWLDKSGVAEWVCGKLHMKKHQKELSEQYCLDRRCEGYKTVCLSLTLISLVRHNDIIFLLLALVAFLLIFIRWMIHADELPLFDQDGVKMGEGVPILSPYFLMTLGFCFYYTENAKLSFEFWLYVTIFGLLFTILYAIAASKKEKEHVSNYIICFFLFSFLGFGIVCTANMYGKETIVQQKQVVVEEVETGARVSSHVSIKDDDGFLGKDYIIISSEEEKLYQSGQIITIAEIKGQFGMRWISILEE